MTQPHWLIGDLLPALPRAGVADYDRLRDEHHRLRGDLDAARTAEQQLRASFADEDERLRQAMLAAARAGEDVDEEAVATTSEAVRSVRLQAAAERVDATTVALCDGVLEATRQLGEFGALGPVGEQLEAASLELSSERIYDPERDREVGVIGQLLSQSRPENVETEVAELRAAAARPAPVPPVAAPAGRTPHPTPRELYWLHGPLLPAFNTARLEGYEALRTRQMRAMSDLSQRSSQARLTGDPGAVAAEAEAVEAICAVADEVLEALAGDLGDQVDRELGALREKLAAEPAAPVGFEIEALERLAGDVWREELAAQVADVRASIERPPVAA